MLDGHGLLGVIFGAILYVICLSGSLIVLVDQLTLWERPQAPAVSSVSPDLLMQVSREGYVRARSAGVAHDIFVNAPTPELPLLSVLAYGEGGGETNHRDWSVDAAGKFGPGTEVPWVAFVQKLHFNLTAPGAIGRYLVGIFGTLLLASLVTGLLAHRRILRDAFRLRWGGGKRLTNADLHNRIGIWALPFHLIVSLTGSLLGLSGLIIFVLALVAYRGDQTKAIASLLGPQPTEDARYAPVPDILPMIARIERDTPGARISQLRFEHVGTAGQQVTISVAAPGYLTRAESYVFAPDATLKHKAGFTDGNAGMRIYGMITPLHYGTYGGVPLKIIYTLLGTGLTLIVATGGNVWLARRRDQGRAAPHLEKLWTALIWGQPLILALTAVSALAGIEALVAIYWMATFATWLVALFLPRPGMTVRTFQIGCGALLTALATMHMARNGIAQLMALAIDLALLLGSGTLLRLAMLSPRGKALAVSARQLAPAE